MYEIIGPENHEDFEEIVTPVYYKNLTLQTI